MKRNEKIPGIQFLENNPDFERLSKDLLGTNLHENIFGKPGYLGQGKNFLEEVMRKLQEEFENERYAYIESESRFDPESRSGNDLGLQYGTDPLNNAAAFFNKYKENYLGKNTIDEYPIDRAAFDIYQILKRDTSGGPESQPDQTLLKIITDYLNVQDADLYQHRSMSHKKPEYSHNVIKDIDNIIKEYDVENQPGYLDSTMSTLGDWKDKASDIAYRAKESISSIPNYFSSSQEPTPGSSPVFGGSPNFGDPPSGGMSIREDSNPFGDFKSYIKGTSTDVVPYGYNFNEPPKGELIPFGNDFKSSIPNVNDTSYISMILSYLSSLGVYIPDFSSLGLEGLKNFVLSISEYVTGAPQAFIDAVTSVLGSYVSVPVTNSLSVIFEFLGGLIGFFPAGIFANFLISVIYMFLMSTAVGLLQSYVFGRPKKFEQAIDAFCDECCLRKRICKIIIKILDYFSDYKASDYSGESYNVYHQVKDQQNKIIITDMNPEMVDIEAEFGIDVSLLKPCLLMFLIDWWNILDPKYSIIDNFQYDPAEEYTCLKFNFLNEMLDHIDISCIEELGFKFISEFVCQIIKKYSMSVQEVDLITNNNMTGFSFDDIKGIDSYDLYTYRRMRTSLKLI